MKTNTIKKILAFVLVLVYVSLTSTIVLAGDPPTIKANTSGAVNESVSTIGAQVLGIITTVGMIVAVVMLVWLAIKYISASPEGKATIKDSSVIYVVGAIILFAASGLVKVLAQYGTSLGDRLQST